MNPDATEFKLIVAQTSARADEIAIVTRSILQMMLNFAAQVEVPASDLAEHRVAPGLESVPGEQQATRILEIHCSETSPKDAILAVQYRGHWFWIDDRDLRSKKVFAFTMLLFSLADTGEKPPLPQKIGRASCRERVYDLV